MSIQSEKADRSLRDDLLNGATAIARHLGWSKDRIYRLYRGQVESPIPPPINRVGGALISRKSALRAWLERIEQGEGA